jgi:hypothetical protein
MPNIFYLPPSDAGYLDDIDECPKTPEPINGGAAPGSLTTIDTAAPQASWYHAGLSRQDAMHMIEFEPTGSFVVRDCDVGGYVITYVHNGRIHHAQCALTDAGYAITGSEQTFLSMYALIEACTKDNAMGDLKCLLRMPKGGPAAPPPKPKDTAAEHEKLAAAALAERQATQKVIFCKKNQRKKGKKEKRRKGRRKGRKKKKD